MLAFSFEEMGFGIVLSGVTGIIGAFIPPLFRYLLARNTAAVQKELTERQELFKEAERIRQLLYTDLDLAKKEIAELQLDFNICCSENSIFRAKLISAKQAILSSSDNELINLVTRTNLFSDDLVDKDICRKKFLNTIQVATTESATTT